MSHSPPDLFKEAVSRGGAANLLGQEGEAYVRFLLERRGAEILDTNWHSAYGELDIVAALDDTLMFIEVKTRRSARFAEAKEAVTWSKRRRIFLTAECWLMAHPEEERQPRFDVVEVYVPAPGKKPVIQYHMNAFDGSEFE